MESIKCFGGMRAGERNKLKYLLLKQKKSVRFAGSFGISKEEIIKYSRLEIATSFHTLVEMNGVTFQGH